MHHRLLLPATPTASNARASEYPEGMNETSKRSFGRTVVAALVLLVAVWLLFGVIIHVISFLFSILILVVAVVAVVWALRILL
jgi:uncharacterized membrane protein